MQPNLRATIGSYDATRPLERACTIPSAWYTDPRVLELERRAVFGGTWQAVARVDQLDAPGRFVTADVAGEPILITRTGDNHLRAFYNVCRHHAAAVATAACGTASVLRCPYHGWTYELDGRLKGAPEFEGVEGFDKPSNGLLPVAVDTWEHYAFIRLSPGGPSLKEFLGELAPRMNPLHLDQLHFVERRTYDLACNWKVFVDNFLDGGYHVPHIHKGLGSVLNYSEYTIENCDRFCVQTTPMKPSGGDAQTAAVRGGERAYYYWLFPNFMLNWYEGYLDTNLVLPLAVDRTRVVFDFFFDPQEIAAKGKTAESIVVADRVQQEDIDVCESVQRGLQSRAYDVGRLSVRREAGEHLFHRLLYHQLSGSHAD